MNFVEKNFNDLSVDELYEILKLREKVFNIEQKCYCVDLDGFDKIASHIYAKKDGKIISYARLFNKNTRYEYANIGRMCTEKKYRGQHISKKLMEKAINSLIQSDSGDIIISSQAYAEDFYTKLGFSRTSKKPYIEENIPHVEMIFKIGEDVKWRKKLIL